MSDIPNFAKLVPGFDFLQGLVKNAGSALPSMGQWVAPTLNPEELQKRIDELKTVQFWLEQNARMLGTTIQALEVQRMTLSTLKTMNVQMTDLRDAMKVAPVASAGSAAAAAAGSVASSLGADALMQAARTAMGGIPGLGKAAAPAPAAAEEPEPAPAPKPKAARPRPAPAEPPAVAATGVVDPMQWWGALTKQFTQLAASAMKDSATDAAKNLAGAMMKQGMDAAGETFKKAVAVPAGVAAKAMSAATQAAGATGARAANGKAAAAKKAPARKTPARKTTRAAKPRAS
ncbi:MAG TPA: PhaM family polyhydroxyalkanoate granule multifunctional regulatory protein [Burkholderiaceae bacterium]